MYLVILMMPMIKMGSRGDKLISDNIVRSEDLISRKQDWDLFNYPALTLFRELHETRINPP